MSDKREGWILDIGESRYVEDEFGHKFYIFLNDEDAPPDKNG